MMKKGVCIFAMGDRLRVQREFRAKLEGSENFHLFEPGKIYEAGTMINLGGESICTFLCDNGLTKTSVRISHGEIMLALIAGHVGVVDSDFSLWKTSDPKAIQWERVDGFQNCFYLGTVVSEGEKLFMTNDTLKGVEVRLRKKKWNGPLGIWDMLRDGIRPVEQKAKVEIKSHTFSPYVVARLDSTGERERVCTACGAGEKSTAPRTCLPEASNFDVATYEQLIGVRTVAVEKYNAEKHAVELKRLRVERLRLLPGFMDEREWKLVH